MRYLKNHPSLLVSFLQLFNVLTKRKNCFCFLITVKRTFVCKSISYVNFY